MASRRMFRPALLAASAIAAMAGSAHAGTKDDVRDLQARMNVAEQALAANTANTVRLGQLESEIQALTGRIETLTFQLDQANVRLDAISAALSGETGGGLAGDLTSDGSDNAGGPIDLTAGNDPIAERVAAGDRVPDNATSVGGGDVSLPLDPVAAFDYASGFLLEGDYQRARSAFSLYVEAFPNHTRTPDAQFRLGEIHLALGENAAAADVFINHIRNYPNNPRAAEAYLKLGSAFSRLEKTTEACQVFKTLKTKFPNAAPPVLQRTDIEMARIGCS